MSASRPPSTSGARFALISLLAVGYGIFLAFVVFWPSPVDQTVEGLLERVIQELHERGVPGFIDYEFIEFTANIALFIPVGIFFGLLVPLRWWPVALLLGPALSGTIELIQKYLLDQRYSSIYDVIANSIGSTIGVLFAVTCWAIVRARDDKVIARYRWSLRAQQKPVHDQ